MTLSAPWRKGKKEKLRIIFFIIIFVVVLFLLKKYMPVEQIRRSINKNSVAVKVEAKGAELSEIIAEMNNPNFPKEVTHRSGAMDMISYQELDNDKITKVFNEFSFSTILNRMDNVEGGFVRFAILPPKHSHDSYLYGFYYSREDKAINIVSEKTTDSNTKVYEEVTPIDRYWYWTEKITDNWWYYEWQFTSDRVVKH